MRRWHRYRLAARVARRQVARHRWRHLLVVVMIFVPILATAGVFSYAATETGRETTALRNDGDWDVAVVPAMGIGQAPVDLDTVGPGVHQERFVLGKDWIVTDRERIDGRGPVLVPTNLESGPESSRRSGRYRMERGRLARSSDEVALSSALADAARVEVGDEVELATSARTVRVTGVLTWKDNVDAYQVLVASGAADLVPGFEITEAGDRYVGVGKDHGVGSLGPGTVTYFWGDTPAARRQLDALGSGGSVVTSRAPSSLALPARIGISIGAATLAALVSVVASAAFAIGARRQLRSVGLLATAGDDGGVARASLVLQGVTSGLVAGALVALVMTCAVALANQQHWLDRLVGESGLSVRISWMGILLGVAIGVFAGALAAWQPARAAVRVPVLSALAGRRPLAVVKARVPLFGLASLVIGCVLLGVTERAADQVSINDAVTPVLPFLGVAALILGAVTLAPALVAALSPLARRARGSLRLALRGLLRSRSQSAATVGALAVGLAIPLSLLSLTVAVPDTHNTTSVVDARGPGRGVLLPIPVDTEEFPYVAAVVGPPGSSDEAAELERTVTKVVGPDAARITTTYPSAPGAEAVERISLSDAARVLPQEVVAQLAAGKAVSGFALAGEDSVTVETTDGPVVVPLAKTTTGEPMVIGSVDGALVDEALVGPPPAGSETLLSFAFASRPSTKVRDALTALSAESGIGSVPTLAEVREPTPDLRPALVITEDRPGFPLSKAAIARLAALIGAVLVSLLVLVITLSLRSVDGEDDRRVALAIGASPRQLRRQRALEGTVLATLGALLAIPVGWLPVVALQLGTDPLSGRLTDNLNWGPGWPAVAVLVVPIILTAVLWSVVPAIRAAILERRATDLILPRT